eukprot:931175-Prorocentrum_minimum.AAC.1
MRAPDARWAPNPLRDPLLTPPPFDPLAPNPDCAGRGYQPLPRAAVGGAWFFPGRRQQKGARTGALKPPKSSD